MDRFKTTGTIRYGQYYRMSLEVEADLARYYRALIPKAYNVIGSRYPPHITIVRPHLETPTKLDAWGIHDGLEVEFEYEPAIVTNDAFLYFWINAYAKRIQDFREELGLERHRHGYHRFHITIGNRKVTLQT